MNKAVFSFPAVPPGDAPVRPGGSARRPTAARRPVPAPAESGTALRLNRFYADDANPLLRCWLDEGFFCPDAAALWPLVLYGMPGVGKTTLAEAVVGRLPGTVIRTSAGDFYRRFVESCATRTLAADLKTLSGADALFVDDFRLDHPPASLIAAWIQVLDELAAGGRPLVVTMSAAPFADSTLPPAIRSRLSGGLVVPVNPPGLAARATIIEQLAARLGLRLDEPDVGWLARQPVPSVPAFSGFLSSVAIRMSGSEEQYRSDSGTRVSRQRLQEFFHDSRLRLDANTFGALVRLVARHYRVRVADITGPCRSRPCVRARSAVAWLARFCLSGSYARIGQMLGNRDASTIRHEVETVEERRRLDAGLDDALNGLRRLLLLSGPGAAAETDRSGSAGRRAKVRKTC